LAPVGLDRPAYPSQSIPVTVSSGNAGALPVGAAGDAEQQDALPDGEGWSEAGWVLGWAFGHGHRGSSLAGARNRAGENDDRTKLSREATAEAVRNPIPLTMISAYSV